jgi:hypothetical protein
MFETRLGDEDTGHTEDLGSKVKYAVPSWIVLGDVTRHLVRQSSRCVSETFRVVELLTWVEKFLQLVKLETLHIFAALAALEPLRKPVVQFFQREEGLAAELDRVPNVLDGDHIVLVNQLAV